MWTWLAHWLGLDNGSGPIYLWWSGVFSALPSFGVAGLLYGLFRKHNCHVRWCPRVGHHLVEGTEWVVCRRHHPDLPNKAPTAVDVRVAMEASDGR